MWTYFVKFTSLASLSQNAKWYTTTTTDAADAAVTPERKSHPRIFIAIEPGMGHGCRSTLCGTSSSTCVLSSWKVDLLESDKCRMMGLMK